MGATTDKIKGKAKELEGRMTGDKLRTAQGKAQGAKGKVEGAVGRGVRKLKGAARNARTRANARTGR